MVRSVEHPGVEFDALRTGRAESAASVAACSVTSADIIPVVLAGGRGRRLWPLSRTGYPKPLHRVLGNETLIQQTVRRVSAHARFASPIILASVGYRHVIAEQLSAIGCAGQQILEPLSRDTAPAIAAAALHALGQAPDALLLLMPSDHVINDLDAFHDTVTRAVPAAQGGRVVLFAVPPSAVSTVYGHIRLGAALTDFPAGREVVGFIEKPDETLATSLTKDPQIHWNSGICLARADVILSELEQWVPKIVRAIEGAFVSGARDGDAVYLSAQAMADCPDISFDYAILEQTDLAAAIVAEFGWSDVGNWTALWQASPKDASDNVLVGNVEAKSASGCYLRSDGPTLAVVGVDDLIVSATDDAVLVAPKGHDEAVGRIVPKLTPAGDSARNDDVERPWGTYRVLLEGAEYKVKRLTVRPGRSLSRQRHRYRSERWTVAQGRAQVWLDGNVHMLGPSDTLEIPSGSVHQLSNPGCEALCLIEVQFGSYLGEDDIVRIDNRSDASARAGQMFGP